MALNSINVNGQNITNVDETLNNNENLIKNKAVYNNISYDTYTTEGILNEFIIEMYIPDGSSANIRISHVYNIDGRHLIAFTDINGDMNNPYKVFESSAQTSIINDIFSQVFECIVNGHYVYILCDWTKIPNGSYIFENVSEPNITKNAYDLNYSPYLNNYINVYMKRGFIDTGLTPYFNYRHMGCISNGARLIWTDNMRSAFVPLKRGNVVKLEKNPQYYNYTAYFVSDLKFILNLDINNYIDKNLIDYNSNPSGIFEITDDNMYLLISYLVDDNYPDFWNYVSISIDDIEYSTSSIDRENLYQIRRENHYLNNLSVLNSDFKITVVHRNFTDPHCLFFPRLTGGQHKRYVVNISSNIDSADYLKTVSKTFNLIFIDENGRTTLACLRGKNLKNYTTTVMIETSGMQPRVAIYADFKESYTDLELEFNIKLYEYIDSIHQTRYLKSVYQTRIEEYRQYLFNNELTNGYCTKLSAGMLYTLNYKFNNINTGTYRIIVGDNNCNRRSYIGPINNTIDNQWHQFDFKCPYENMFLCFYTIDADISENPYVEIHINGEVSYTDQNANEYMLKSSENITKLSDNVKSNTYEINEIKKRINGYYEFDACIIGAGSAGLNAAAALARNGYKVCIVDNNKKIGGTLANAWMNCCAATPDTPFFREVAKEMIYEGTAAFVDTIYQPIPVVQNISDYNQSLIRQQYRKDSKGEYCITFDVDEYVSKMNTKLSSVHMFLECLFVDAIKNENNEVTDVHIQDKSGNTQNIKARIFIDSSADGVLCRNLNSTEDVDFFVGNDDVDTYNSGWGFTEEHAGTKNRNSLNPPTLIFRTKYGKSEDLSPIDISGLSYYLNPYYYADASKLYSYANSSSFLTGEVGYQLVQEQSVQESAQTIINNTIPKILPYWKYTKTYGTTSSNSHKITYAKEGVKYQGFDSIAPMLGIRETYRIACERMLNENDLYVKIDPSNLETQNVLDRPIAIGNHPVDIHGSGTGASDAINANRKPYFVKYGSIIPKNLKNVFIACRGAGFTHIGAATFRLNKDMMQIGWLAGCASVQFLQNNLSDVRNINGETLQNDSEFKDLCSIVYNIIN